MSTTLDPVIDEIVALITAACPGVTVADGFPFVQDGPDVITVGGTAEDTASGEVTSVAFGQFRLRETYDVQVTIYCTSGDNDQTALRKRATGYYNAIVAAWRGQMASRTGLGGLVLLAYPFGLALSQTNADTLESGEPHFARLTFHIHVEADDIP